MDQPLSGFVAARLRGSTLAPDYGQLTASLAAQQSASATGVAATLLAAPVRPVPSPPVALATLFSAASGWAGAVAALRGRFHPQVQPSRASIPRQQT